MKHKGYCWNCGYSLHGLRGTRCPECGKGPKPPPPDVDIASEIAGMVVFVHHAAWIYFSAMGVLLGALLLIICLSLLLYPS